MTRVEAIHPACRDLRDACCGPNHLRPHLYDWLVDQYLAALVKHDPSGKGVRFTENTAEIPIGDGLWVGASEAPSTFKIYAVDPASSQVGFYGR